MTTDRPAGLYIHVPFCATKCPYCDFYSDTGPFDHDRFGDLISGEAASYLGDPSRVETGIFKRFDTIYLGGGTPSLLDAHAAGKVLSGLMETGDIDPRAEITIEVNPDDVDGGKARRWREAGIGRVSLGVQSLDDRCLEWLCRRHDSAAAKSAFAVLRETGVEQLGIDLMFGIPGQTLDDWDRTLREAIALEPEHLSCYQLTVVDSTPLGSQVLAGEVILEEDDSLRAMFLHASKLLTDSGYDHYEVSNYALGGGPRDNRSRHNLKYWDHTPYLGLGPSAHSFDGCRRWWNPSSIERWAEMSGRGMVPRDGIETLTGRQLRMEELYFGFRTEAGLAVETAAYFDGGEEILVDLADKGYVTLTGGRAVPTLEGYLFSDRLPSMFL